MRHITTTILPRLLLTTLLIYIIILILSLMIYHFHQPMLLSNYINQSLVYAGSKYVWMGLGWIGFGVGIVYVRCMRTGRQQEQEQLSMAWYRIVIRHRMLLICLILTILYIHSYVTINSTVSQHNTLCQIFKTGKTPLAVPRYPTNHDHSWPGWTYYYSDNYYEQTKARLEHSRARAMELGEYEGMLVALKDANEGIYSVRSWLVNHRLVYRMLGIGWGFGAGVGVIGVWVVWAFVRGCGGRCWSRGMHLCMILVFWLMIPLFFLVSQLLHSAILLNSHPLCMPTPNSSFVSLKISTASITLLSALHLNLIQDPNNIYSNICINMQKYFQQPLLTDARIVRHVFGLWWVGLVGVIVVEIVGMMIGSEGSGKAERKREGIKYQSVGQQE